jgi:hypothetical protein
MESLADLGQMVGGQMGYKGVLGHYGGEGQMCQI